ncbi:MAG: alcohol dehydrogenase catalytic domain-containing protein [Candidatus Bathyarchaeota archaeon]|nr:MAG: alcohol dehydrogenase catalytic domain-containing protein [Candidatus Bathyarchaeota archaeon]
MKAAIYYELANVPIEEIPTPKITPDDVLVNMKASGICGSDLMEWYQKPRAPIVLGHEPSGIIVKAGKKVKGFSVGDRIFTHHHVACLNCYFCQRGAFTLCTRFQETHLDPGGFAEYFRVPSANLYVDTLQIPENVSFEEATLIEPIACGIRALGKCNIQPSDSVLVFGAGPSGLILTKLLRAFGAGEIIVTDPIDYRLKAAKRFEADLTINPEKDSLIDAVKGVTAGRGTDQVIVTAPSLNAYISAIELCRKGGAICVFAPTNREDFLKISPHKLFFSEVKITSSYSASHVETRTALNLIKSGRLRAKELITHTFPLSQTSNALQKASTKECIKVVIVNEY